MNIAVTVALLPALFPGDGGESLSETTVLISAPLATEPPPTTAVTVPPTTVPPTTVATAPPTTAAPKVAAAPKRQAVDSPPTTHTHTHTHSHPPKPKPKPTTTTTAPPPPPPQQQTSGKTESGRATWYELEGARAGICAHKTLPFGTIVTVTNTNTGKSIQCEVGDRGPFVDGYIIDLFRTDFEQLAPTSSGWFPAKITW